MAANISCGTHVIINHTFQLLCNDVIVMQVYVHHIHMYTAMRASTSMFYYYYVVIIIVGVAITFIWLVRM